MLTLLILPRASKQLSKLPQQDARAIEGKLEAYAASRAAPVDVKALKGQPGLFRLRHGEWRAIFEIDAKAGTMTVTGVANRREAGIPMNDKDIQILKDKHGEPAFAVVPYARWQAMAATDDEEDAWLVKLHKAERARKETPLPWKIGKRIAAGENAVKVYRQWRGLTQAALARKAGSVTAYISQIETGVKPGGRAIMRKIAAALGVPAAVLLDDD